MAVKPYIVQRRMMELGRVRLGEKGAKGEPRKLTTLRFTSASRAYLDAIAAIHGGTVRPWEGAPEEGMFEVTTEAAQIDIILPPVFSTEDGSPTTAYSQFFEMWSGGGCQRRCDGETESAGKKPQPCLCNPEERDCKITTRVSFMIPDVPGLGVWRLESHGYNAAVELPGTLEVLILAAAEHKFIPAVLRVEQRTKKVPGEGTRRFIVPVIELPNVTIRQLASGDVPLTINGPTVPPERPALPAAGSTLPADASFEQEPRPGFGEPPPLPDLASAGEPEDEGRPASDPSVADSSSVSPAAPNEPASPADDHITAAQKKKLNLLVGTLRDAGHITTEQIYKRCQIEPVASDYDENGTLHWSPLRDRLTKTFASGLIEALTVFEVSLEDGSYFERRAVEVQQRVAGGGGALW